MAQASEDQAHTGARFLAALADPARPTLPFRAAIVVAHPDDETIGAGAQLSRFSDLTVVHVTDGAPRSGVDAMALGFSGPATYAAARRLELESAMALAGIEPERLVALNWPDQEASAHMVEIATELGGILNGAEIVITHVYEGGHPDHDATAFATHAACRLIGRNGDPPCIVEIPLYRAGERGWSVQSFTPGSGPPEVIVALHGSEREMKRHMLAAFLTQLQVLARFGVEQELFRLAPRYDFTRLPGGGSLLYEQEGWGSVASWLENVEAAAAALGLDGWQ